MLPILKSGAETDEHRHYNSIIAGLFFTTVKLGLDGGDCECVRELFVGQKLARLANGRCLLACLLAA